jgi:hypothetical protein
LKFLIVTADPEEIKRANERWLLDGENREPHAGSKGGEELEELMREI